MIALLPNLNSYIREGSLIMKCSACQKKINTINNFQCRICFRNYCEDCSLVHYGLYETKNGDVKYKNVFKAIWWIIKRTFK